MKKGESGGRREGGREGGTCICIAESNAVRIAIVVGISTNVHTSKQHLPSLLTAPLYTSKVQLPYKHLCFVCLLLLIGILSD